MRPGFKAYAQYSTVGLELASAILLGLFGGRWLDQRYGTTWMGLTGMLLGALIGFRAILRAAKEMSKDAEREERDDGDKRP